MNSVIEFGRYVTAVSRLPTTESDQGELVGVIQELLRNQKLRKVPGARNVSFSAVPSDDDAELFGEFGRYTKRALKFFQQHHGLTVTNPLTVDSATLRALVQTRPSPTASGQKWTPSPGRAFLTQYLNIPDSIIFRVVTLICSWEESPVNGGFLNWKPQDDADAVKTGLSFGILQFIHGSEQLGALLTRFNTMPVIFNSVFGVNSADATAMIAFAISGQAGLNDDGSPAAAGDAKFDFQKASLWKKKFLAAGANIELQKLQIEHAAEGLRAIHTARKTVWTRITSERGRGFMLDPANQFGEGAANGRYTAAVTANPTGTEDVLLQFIENHVPAIHKARRTFFRVDSPLSNSASRHVPGIDRKSASRRAEGNSMAAAV